MAENISVSANISINELDILKTLDWCLNKEKSREEEVAERGRQSEFIRSTKESEELSRNSMTAMRMKITLAEKTQSSNDSIQTKTVPHNPIVDQIVEDNCNQLTEQLQAAMTCSPEVTCNPSSEFRHISGCCNNLQNTTLGIE